MSMHPTISAALAEQHRRGMIARGETRRITRAAGASRLVPAHPTRIIARLVAAARRPVTRRLEPMPPRRQEQAVNHDDHAAKNGFAVAAGEGQGSGS
jgi:hypothetical protein